MAQNREQRYRNAAEMRRALQQGGSETTLTRRSEANTVLFPSPSPTVAPTQQSAPQTAACSPVQCRVPSRNTGETTIVARPAKRRGAALGCVAVAAVFLVAGVGGFFAYQKRKALRLSSSRLPTSSRVPRPFRALRRTRRLAVRVQL